MKEIYTHDEKVEFADYFLNLMLTCWIMQESLILLKGTNKYRGALKIKVDQLLVELGRIVNKDLAAVFGIDDKNLYRMLNNTEDVTRRLARRSPSMVDLIARLMSKYDENPAAFLKLNGIDSAE